MIFEIENWLWKPKVCQVQCQISNHALIYKKTFKLRKCSLQFDAEVAENFLNGLYYVCSRVSTSAILLQVSLEDTWPQKGEASFKALHTGLNILFLVIEFAGLIRLKCFSVLFTSCCPSCPLTGFFWLLSHVIYLKLTREL